MKPFFGLSNRIASIIVSFLIFGYSIYSLFSDGILSTDNLRLQRIRGSGSHSFSHESRSYHVKYDFDSSTVSLFGLYELEIAIIKVCIGFLLFIILLVGATQRSRILLRIWMMILAITIVLVFLSTIVRLTDSHVHDYSTSEFQSYNMTKFFITMSFCLWFFAVVLSLHEEMEVGHKHAQDDNNVVRNYVAKKGSVVEEKCPPFYDC